MIKKYIQYGGKL